MRRIRVEKRLAYEYTEIKVGFLVRDWSRVSAWTNGVRLPFPALLSTGESKADSCATAFSALHGTCGIGRWIIAWTSAGRCLFVAPRSKSVVSPSKNNT